MPETRWEIGRLGRLWNKDEAWERLELIPEKFEMLGGQLQLSVEERENLLGVLLELVGTDRAVQFGDPSAWRAAVAKLPA